jgi:hypothetical protein
MKFILCVLGFAASTYAWSADRLLPNLLLGDKDGVLSTEQTISQEAPWVLLVVDAENPGSQLALTRLYKAEGDWGNRLAIVALGKPEALKAMIAKNDKLVGVRWYRDMTGKLMTTLNLRGVPAVLGIKPNNEIAWQAIGLPERNEKAQSLVGTWMRHSVAQPITQVQKVN